MSGNEDVKLIKEESLDTQANRQRVVFARYSYFIAAALLVLWSLLAMVVILASFFAGHEPPNWAVALESASVTGVLAVTFKDHLPSPGSRSPP